MRDDENKNTWIWIIVGVCIFALLSIFNFARFGTNGVPGMMGGSYGSGMMFFGWMTWLLMVALMLAGIYWLVRTANRK